MTTTTLAGVTTEGGGGHTTSMTPVAGSSPPNLVLPPPPSNRMMMPLPPRLPAAGDEGVHEDRHASTATSQEDVRPPFLIDVAIRCTAPGCSCDCFTPCKSQIRTCGGCGHGWVSHALDKLGFTHLLNCHQVELVQPSIAFDVASLMLYGTQAIPIRLKILLDRLFSVLRRDEVMQVLHGFGWTNEDYARGYILQDPNGHVLDKWLMATREEEPLILQQFLRFGETKTIAQQLLLQESCEKPEFVVQSPRTESDIKKFIERTKRTTAVSSSSSLKYSAPSYSVSSVISTASSLPTSGKSAARQPSSVSSTHSLSPSAVSPVNNCGSPVTLSPLNRLQNMQPYDYRRERSSPDDKVSENLVVCSIAYRSPSSSPGASTLAVSTSSTTSVNPTSDVPRPNAISPSFSGTDVGMSDDDSSSAINLTRTNPTTTGYMDSIFAARKVRHLRKSANPMKRRWNTMVLSTLSTNPATGKKRVQCHVCLKTFCDKGALKIHFSAVHLREMHKCTVEGCNMMFSSRRSRNRHSANPNPKLHTPNYRRKINPHDGRSANPYPVIPPTGLPAFNNALLSGPLSNHLDEVETLSETDRLMPMANRNAESIHPRLEEAKQQMEDRSLSAATAEPKEELPLSLTKKRRTDGVPEADADEDKSKQEGMDLSMKDNRNSSSKGVRKRKSMNPTKCHVNSDDDMQYVSTDDSSSDTYIDQDNDENGIMDSKSDYLSSDGLDSKDDDDDELDRRSVPDQNPKKASSLVSSSSSPPRCPPVTATSQAASPAVSSSVSSPPVQKYVTEKQNGFVGLEPSTTKEVDSQSTARESEDISENPLRHLESLSLGSFSHLMSSRNSFCRTAHVSSGVSYHAPGLGLGSSVITTTAASRTETPPPPPLPHNEQTPHLMNHSSPLISPPALQPVSSGHASSDPESSLQEQQMPLLPVYRDASIVGAVEIPVDKENPRRCTACGKIFQNHFGVKTHYQNVHLKLMHKCTVEGCNAAFPSKRSRDRHSANLNLHRKLLSTTSEKQPSYFDKGAIYPYHADAALRGDFFRLYDPQTLPLSFADLYHSRLPPESSFLRSQYPSHLMPGFHPAFMLPPTTTTAPSLARHPVNDGLGSGRDSPVSSVSTPTSSPRPQESPRREQSLKLEEELKPDSEGRYSCDICEKKFHENVVLREHYEKCHSRELLRCGDDRCNKVFLSGRTRSLHADEVHKDKVVEAS